MAYQSLYRRYRPRRFGEVRRPGPRRHRPCATPSARAGSATPTCSAGPGARARRRRPASWPRSSTASSPVDGEPCLRLRLVPRHRGRARRFDLHELDAASNNGVDDIRELIDRAALGTPGPHEGVHPRRGPHAVAGGVGRAAEDARGAARPRRVRAGDDRPAEGAAHHPQPHPALRASTCCRPTTLEEHVRCVVDDAGLDVDQEALEHALAPGRRLGPRHAVGARPGRGRRRRGRAPPTTSTSCSTPWPTATPARALAAVAAAAAAGRDPRLLAESLAGPAARRLPRRDAAPTSRHLPDRDREQAAELAERFERPFITRCLEVLGEALVDMRQAPDPRVALEVALVRLDRTSRPTRRSPPWSSASTGSSGPRAG